MACGGCGGDVPPSKGTKPRKWCSESCRVRAFETRNPEYRRQQVSARCQRRKLLRRAARKPKACRLCGGEFMAPRPNAIYCSDRCRYKSFSATRRTRLKSGNVREPYTFMQVAERDEWTCRVCALPVDRAKAYPQGEAGSIDHVIPLVAGGRDSLDNVQLAHLDCNRLKGARSA